MARNAHCRQRQTIVSVAYEAAESGAAHHLGQNQLNHLQVEPDGHRRDRDEARVGEKQLGQQHASSQLPAVKFRAVRGYTRV